ncbi:MAG: HIT domain-containing protein [Acidobacteriota bacterium]|nr:MAG: HIT domain-containing protein [Acidobacteriota bacterium]
MDILWSPWRYDYIRSDSPTSSSGCVFCDVLSNGLSDDENFILSRGEYNFVILNIYPYTSGHLMVVPFAHVDLPENAGEASTAEMMTMVARCQKAIRQVYTPDGINIGMNLGKAAGAGVADHYHMHLLPRWVGDVNFMTAIGQTRTIPETLIDSYNKLKDQI